MLLKYYYQTIVDCKMIQSRSGSEILIKEAFFHLWADEYSML